jgi:N-acetylmuramoyl-L-alanine amidase
MESDWRLGDRHLYVRSPMLRGDDVALLQRRLGQLGFDPGRVDGIYGPDTSSGVRDFQRNAGLHQIDGVCGHATYSALERFAAKRHEGPSISEVREAEIAFSDVAMNSRVVVGNLGGCNVFAEKLSDALRKKGWEVLLLSQIDSSIQAKEANFFRPSLYVGLCLGECFRASYYSTNGFTSLRGKSFAEKLFKSFQTFGLGDGDGCQGMALPILRETSMPAVLCQFSVNVLEGGQRLLDAILECFPEAATL